MVTQGRQIFPATCSLCEACCGCLWEISDDEIVAVHSDPKDPLSDGFVCPKGRAIPALERAPDRLRLPMVKHGDSLVSATWDAAYARVEQLLKPILDQHGRDAVAVYVGNGAAHNYALSGYLGVLVEQLGSRNFFTSGTVDQVPRQVVSGLLYGSPSSVPVPDFDRTDLLWIIGANPLESNGSMVLAPGPRKRLSLLRKRGGRLVVFDPRKTLTARMADEHFAIRPTSDPLFLAAVANVLFQEGPSSNTHAISKASGLDEIQSLLLDFTPEFVSEAISVPPNTIRRLALELRDTPKAAIYGRMGTTATRFGTLTCWLIDLVNLLAGNLDCVGGSMFSKPLAAQENTLGVTGSGAGFSTARWRSRVSGYPEVMGELPVICLPEEIETPGPGQIRALITVAANPVLSNPNENRLKQAMLGLDALISLDIYANETTRMADVILPSPPRLARPNYDAFFYQFPVRAYARYTRPYRPLANDERSDRTTLLTLATIAKGVGRASDIEALDEELLVLQIEREIARPNSRISHMTTGEVLRHLLPVEPTMRRIDLALRIGPYGDCFNDAADGISLKTLEENPHGVDLGPLIPRLPEMLRTPSGEIELMHGFVPTELEKLKAWMGQERGAFVLVGRRQLRSNNSWMHNLNELSHKNNRCNLQMNPKDAKSLGVEGGESVTVASKSGSIRVRVELDDGIAPGVVSLPHGWGHGDLEAFQKTAFKNAGTNVNRLTDENLYDEPTGTAAVNGFEVSIRKL